MIVRSDGDNDKIRGIDSRFRGSRVVSDPRVGYGNVTGMSFGYMDWIQKELLPNNRDQLAVMQYFGTYSRGYILNAERIHAAYNKEYREYVQGMNRENGVNA